MATDKNTMQKLLDDVYSIILADQKETEEKQRRGDLFNVFNILNLQTYEVRTHSAFLSELLDPKGSHGMKDGFLKLFLSSIYVFDNWVFNTSDAKVRVEESVGNINEQGTEGGRIDIIISSHNKAIIIENKIYASDQTNQLIRYSNYGKIFDDYKLLYLTLDGHEASEESCGDMTVNKDYYSISYKTEILEWLVQCQDKCRDKELVFCSLKQYCTLIKELTGQMENTENNKKLIDLLTQDDNAIKTASILDHADELYGELIEKYITQKLKQWVEEKGYELEEDEGDCWYQIFPKNWNHHCIAFQNYNNRGRYFYIGVLKVSGRQHKQMQLNVLKAGTNAEWPFGWNSCGDELDNYVKIVSGKTVKYIIDTTESIIRELADCKDKLQELKIEL